MSLYNYLTRDHMDKAEKVTDRYQMSTWKKGYLQHQKFQGHLPDCINEQLLIIRKSSKDH